MPYNLYGSGMLFVIISAYYGFDNIKYKLIYGFSYHF